MLEQQLESLEVKVEALTNAVIALTTRLETNNQSDAYRQAKAIEAEPTPLPVAKTEKVEVAATAANDATFDDCKQLALQFRDPSVLSDFLKTLGVNRVSELKETQYPEFLSGASALLKKAS